MWQNRKTGEIITEVMDVKGFIYKTPGKVFNYTGSSEKYFIGEPDFEYNFKKIYPTHDGQLVTLGDVVYSGVVTINEEAHLLITVEKVDVKIRHHLDKKKYFSSEYQCERYFKGLLKHNVELKVTVFRGDKN